MNRQPSANYVAFVDSMAKKILDPATKILPVPKKPKCARIHAQADAAASYPSSS